MAVLNEDIQNIDFNVSTQIAAYMQEGLLGDFATATTGIGYFYNNIKEYDKAVNGIN